MLGKHHINQVDLLCKGGLASKIIPGGDLAEFIFGVGCYDVCIELFDEYCH